MTDNKVNKTLKDVTTTVKCNLILRSDDAPDGTFNHYEELTKGGYPSYFALDISDKLQPLVDQGLPPSILQGAIGFSVQMSKLTQEIDRTDGSNVAASNQPYPPFSIQVMNRNQLNKLQKKIFRILDLTLVNKDQSKAAKEEVEWVFHEAKLGNRNMVAHPEDIWSYEY